MKKIEELKNGIHIVLDMETLDTDPSAIVPSIGFAVGVLDNGLDLKLRFEHEREYSKHFVSEPKYNTVDGFEFLSIPFKLSIDEQSKIGRTVSSSTLKWWFNQTQIAKDDLFSDDTESIDVTMFHITSFLRAVENIGDHTNKKVFLWGFGAAFDQPTLRSLFAQSDLTNGNAGEKYNFNYSNELCLRTLMATQPKVDSFSSPHTAVGDAIAELMSLLTILDKM